MSGALASLACSGSGFYGLAWVCLVPLLWAIRDASVSRASALGGFAGIVAYIGAAYWIVEMFERFAGWSWPIGLLALLSLAAGHGSFFAAWAGATRFVTRNTAWSVIWVAPVVWAALETVWPQLFPYYLGASQHRLTTLIQIVDVTGILGVSFMLVCGNALIFAVVERRLEKKEYPWRAVGVCAVSLAVILGYGSIRIHNVDASASGAEIVTVGLVQANFAAGDKHADRNAVIREHQEISRQLVAANPPDLVVWPETLLDITSRRPLPNGRLPTEALGNLRVPLLFGAVFRIGSDGTTRYSNGAALVDENGRILGSYEKTRLVPFGEYVPFGDVFPWLYAWSPYTIPYSRGESLKPLEWGKRSVSVSICYEDIVPAVVNALMRGGPDRRPPDLMINVSDDSWFGNTIEPAQHLAVAGFRAIEHRRPLVRATPTGISAIIDPVGRVVLRTEQWKKATLVGRVPIMQGRTIYAQAGNWVGWLCIALGVLALSRAWHLRQHAL